MTVWTCRGWYLKIGAEANHSDSLPMHNDDGDDGENMTNNIWRTNMNNHEQSQDSQAMIADNAYHTVTPIRPIVNQFYQHT